jgi:hypothetical protein
MVSVSVCVGVWCIRSDEVVGGEAVRLSGWVNEGGCVCVCVCVFVDGVYVYGVGDGDGGGQGSSTAQDAFKPKLGAGAEGPSFPAGMRTGVDAG